MALIDCRDCGNEISTKAISCPKCGRKANGFRQPISALGVVGALLIYTVIMFLISIFFSGFIAAIMLGT